MSLSHSDEPTDPVPERKPPHRRWVGVLLSFLVAGAGLFFAGKRRAGVRWFFALTVLGFLDAALAPLAVIPGLWLFGTGTTPVLGLFLWMLALSYKPVPRLGLRGWVGFLVFFSAWNAAEIPLTDRLARPLGCPHRVCSRRYYRAITFLSSPPLNWFSRPKRGDVIVFRTEQWDRWNVPEGQFWMKRVAGLPGETVQIKQGRLILNGKALNAPAPLAAPDFEIPGMAFPGTNGSDYVIPDKCYFVLGDNGTNSLDSWHFGTISCKSVLGKATKIYWPWRHAGDIR